MVWVWGGAWRALSLSLREPLQGICRRRDEVDEEVEVEGFRVVVVVAVVAVVRALSMDEREESRPGERGRGGGAAPEPSLVDALLVRRDGPLDASKMVTGSMIEIGDFCYIPLIEAEAAIILGRLTIHRLFLPIRTLQ